MYNLIFIIMFQLCYDTISSRILYKPVSLAAISYDKVLSIFGLNFAKGKLGPIIDNLCDPHQEYLIHHQSVILKHILIIVRNFYLDNGKNFYNNPIIQCYFQNVFTRQFSNDIYLKFMCETHKSLFIQKIRTNLQNKYNFNQIPSSTDIFRLLISDKYNSEIFVSINMMISNKNITHNNSMLLDLNLIYKYDPINAKNTQL
ncbi:hypothetical protein [Acanthamoeba polyphaga mimivirus]|uniref:Uncharacterized protein n=5 Tax=Mimivirus TaxID=315393 RepID=A0A0G2Y1A9_MIMIV|nr:hypothetical protein [Samba virus]AKI79470.1 hypothetical protein [Acanthamoeba polyphaga mimivirus]AKI81361.1 hypothetical protein [Acanthamoeba polyphaga mimivirus]